MNDADSNNPKLMNRTDDGPGMMYDVEVSVLREVRADSPEEAEKIARSLVIAMPHLNPRTCPTDPEVNATVHELEETGAAEAAAERRASLERAKAFAEAMAGKPYVAPGYNAPVDPDEPDVELVDLPGPDDEAQGYMADRASETDG